MSANRAARRRAEKEGKKTRGFETPQGASIHLENPVAQHFETFIAGNATVCRNPEFHDETVQCSAPCSPMVEENSALGQTLVLCGAGPSLAEHIAEYAPKADQVWGCNSAAMWLHSQGHPVTHGFAIDQTPHMVAEWMDAPDIEYLIASSVHPHLVEHLVRKNRKTRIFHNFVGVKKPPVMVEPGKLCEYEYWLYLTMYAQTVCVGSGLNAVTRALDVAKYMGFAKIYVLGADCALRISSPPPADKGPGTPEHTAWLTGSTVMHVDGGNALASGATPMVLAGEIDGRLWASKPDMLISAVWLMEMAKASEGSVELIGDTLPNALKDKPQEFIDRLPHLVDSSGKDITYQSLNA